jgi:hypothetical protein
MSRYESTNVDPATEKLWAPDKEIGLDSAN